MRASLQLFRNIFGVSATLFETQNECAYSTYSKWVTIWNEPLRIHTHNILFQSMSYSIMIYVLWVFFILLWKEKKNQIISISFNNIICLAYLDTSSDNIHRVRSIQPNSNRSDWEKWSTSKGGPVFSKLFQLDRTDPLSFGPKFLEILVEWIAPTVTIVLQNIALVRPNLLFFVWTRKIMKKPMRWLLNFEWFNSWKHN